MGVKSMKYGGGGGGGVFVGGGIGMVGQGTRGEVSIDGVRVG